MKSFEKWMENEIEKLFSSFTFADVLKDRSSIYRNVKFKLRYVWIRRKYIKIPNWQINRKENPALLYIIFLEVTNLLHIWFIIVYKFQLFELYKMIYL